MRHLNIYIIIAIATLALLPLLGNAQQYTGTSGMAHIPTGEMHHEGDAFIGAHFLNKSMMPDTGFLYPANGGEKYNTFDYYLALAPFNWLELSFVCTERIRSKDAQGNITKWSKDRYASVKIQPLKEGKHHPAIAIGCNDFATAAFYEDRPDVQLYFLNWYVASTKHFNFSGNEIGLTLAYRYFFRDYNSKWNGIVGGIEGLIRRIRPVERVFGVDVIGKMHSDADSEFVLGRVSVHGDSALGEVVSDNLTFQLKVTTFAHNL